MMSAAGASSRWRRCGRGSGVPQGQFAPAGAEAVTISIGNFKGGVGKTTTAVTLAQGMSLLGHKVLVIDTDPQGSLTTLFGILPDTEVEESRTPSCRWSWVLRPRFATRFGRPTGMASTWCRPRRALRAEFALPARQTKEEGFEFWNVLNYGIDDVRRRLRRHRHRHPPCPVLHHDQRAFGVNGIIMPLPPSTLGLRFGGAVLVLFSDLTNAAAHQPRPGQAFDFMNILLSRVDSSDATGAIVKQWIQSTYANRVSVLPMEIPKSAVTASATVEFGTVLRHHQVRRQCQDVQTGPRCLRPDGELHRNVGAIRVASPD
jgi:chromosome partitioning protein